MGQPRQCCATGAPADGSTLDFYDNVAFFWQPVIGAASYRFQIATAADGFSLEASLIRSAAALTRLCLVLAITTRYLVAQGAEVVKQGQRRWVDPRWFRGS